ncbi:hypothetical protein EV385_0221 [Krasilnikovia cinnamomea]|uniref:Secreted protein n=1 Tax=Krasilnikovia cinnamomea TaxID=349313 RepID=A0A4Q7ZE11_9ACTN|nr:hypothetical protein [Krasilnikovia cinnamomea]RZU48504.1 hypothetical protein EV385_0221 [Krasilnikovia cinnamomea]
MPTAQLDRPRATPDVTPPVGSRVARVLRRVGALRHTSPGRLQLILAALLTLGLLTGLVSGLAARAAQTGTADLGGRAQPLLIEAETIYSKLADADTTAAQAFLAGGLEPTTLTARYDDDLRLATAALASAARRVPAGSASADAVHELATGVARYAALVATARANNRQGLPVGAAYLSAASTLNRDTLLPQAQTLFRTAQDEVDAGYGDARSSVWVTLLVLLMATLLVTLLLAQRYLSRTTHRTFNLPLVAATVVAAVLALGAGGLLAHQRAHLHNADTDGSAPVARLAEARILALRQRGDEALTLVARSGKGAYEDDFGAADRQVHELLDQLAVELDGPAASAVGDATRLLTAYGAAHRKVRALDDDGDYDDAVDLAIGDDTSSTFGAATGAIGAAMDDRKAAFTAEIGTAGRGLGVLAVLGPLLALLVCALAVVGVRPRLEEYR